jgi:chorismate lyase/3-hydroxybenzoate synthase
MRGAGGPIDVQWVPPPDLERTVREAGDRALLVVSHGGELPSDLADRVPTLQVPNPVLAEGCGAEVWSSRDPVRTGTRGPLRWSATTEALFGRAVVETGDDLEDDALGLYRALFGLLRDVGIAEIQRVWNYLPDINGAQGGVERYRLFNAGRARAFEEFYGAHPEGHFPAATTVGTSGTALLTAFIAAGERGVPFENPRQVSAYRYPGRYGTASPSFARGTIAPRALGHAFFLSGTASVVGSESAHPGDPRAQLDETRRNIEAVLDEAAASGIRRRSDLGSFDLLKVYVRDPADLPALRRAQAAWPSAPGPTVWVRADICRPELLVEVDGATL